MEQKELIFFEWVIFDNCNLQCPYCVNKGEFSHKDTSQMLYNPGREVDVARKIVELSPMAKKVVVNLTGGEPLLARNIKEVISILKTSPNVKINLITNFALIEKVMDHVESIDSILVSLHIRLRSTLEMDHFVSLINRIKTITSLSLSQVDYELSYENRNAIRNLSLKTGLKVDLQSFIPPWTEKGRMDKGEEIRDATFTRSFGKRCSLGHFYYFLLPDGTYYHGLWCDPKTRKTGNLLAPFEQNQESFYHTSMAKCPASSCACNYNNLYYRIYREECRRLGYPRNEVFGRINVRIDYELFRKMRQIKQKFVDKLHEKRTRA